MVVRLFRNALFGSWHCTSVTQKRKQIRYYIKLKQNAYFTVLKYRYLIYDTIRSDILY